MQSFVPEITKDLKLDVNTARIIENTGQLSALLTGIFREEQATRYTCEQAICKGACYESDIITALREFYSDDRTYKCTQPENREFYIESLGCSIPLQHTSTAYIKENYVLVVTRFSGNSTSLEDWVIFEKITPQSLFVDEVEKSLLIHAPNWRAVKNILSPLNPPPMHFTVFDQQVVNEIFRETFQYPSIISGVRRYATFQMRAIMESLFSTCRIRVRFVIHQTAVLILETIVKHAYRFDLYR
jgi:hypothetical protein